MRTLFQIIQQEFQKENEPCACIHRCFLRINAKEVPVPVCWLEKKAELPEP